MKTLLTLCFITAGFAGFASSSLQAEETTTHHHMRHHRHHHMRHHRHHHMMHHSTTTAQKPAAETAPSRSKCSSAKHVIC